jgi:hypothetical protein
LKINAEEIALDIVQSRHANKQSIEVMGEKGNKI